jgi:hypothetical protein
MVSSYQAVKCMSSKKSEQNIKKKEKPELIQKIQNLFEKASVEEALMI